MNDDAQKARSYADAMLAARGPCARCVDFAARGADLQMKLDGTLMGLAAAAVEHTSMRARIAELEALRRENARTIELLQHRGERALADEDISDAVDNDGVPSPCRRGDDDDDAAEQRADALALRESARSFLLREHADAIAVWNTDRAELLSIAREALDRDIAERTGR